MNISLPTSSQAYAYARGFEEPSVHWSGGARRLYDHARHPIALGPLLLAASTPVMSLDRAAVAFGGLAYMLYCSKLGMGERRSRPISTVM